MDCFASLWPIAIIVVCPLVLRGFGILFAKTDVPHEIDEFVPALGFDSHSKILENDPETEVIERVPFPLAGPTTCDDDPRYCFVLP